MIEILLMGLLLGMRHALESDHVAAVASLVTRSPSLADSIRLGSLWGLGHTITLFAFGAAVMLLDRMIPARMALMLEFSVGIMLVVLGIDVLRRARREGLRFRLHQHDDGQVHLHALAQAGLESGTAQHTHPTRFGLRALLVGIMHGMAGSAALIMLALQTVHSIATGLAYIALFGTGSIAGMALLSLAISLPLRHVAGHHTAILGYLQMAIGMAALLIGTGMMYSIGSGGELL